jgi:formylglycine-generating enzyme required for sulfatase activity
MTRYALIAIAVLSAVPGFAAEDAGDASATKETPAPIKNSIGMTLVPIPAGAFQMGSSDREPGRNNNEGQVDVTISKPFLISDTEVTQQQWTEVMGNAPWEGAVSNSFAKKGARFPAVGISWDDAVAFCKELTDSEREAGKIPSDVSYSLPTEAQWEYACRAGSRKAYTFGHDAAKLSDHAWWGGDIGNGNASAERYAHEVASKQPNAWKLFDMHGNVSEWCLDGFEDKLPGGKDPLAPTRGYDRAVRGGGWTDGAVNCRSAWRWRESSASSSYSRGFRLVRTLGTADGAAAEGTK